jgi:hypothetical protein
MTALAALLDHGTLLGLGDDDHTQYHTDARALTWLGTRSTTDLPEGTNLYNRVPVGGTAGQVLEKIDATDYNTQWVTPIVDHGALTGLLDDDHTQYLLANGTRPLGGNWDIGSFSITNGSSAIYMTSNSLLHTDGTDKMILNSGFNSLTYETSGGNFSTLFLPNTGTNRTWYMPTSASGTVALLSDIITDHGALGGLGDDDHTQYHTDARALTWLGTRSTTDLPEGINLYYTASRVNTEVFEGTNFVDGTTVDFTVTAGTSVTAEVITGAIDHDALLNFVANEHIDHSTVNLTINGTASRVAVTGAGGDITTSRSWTVDIDAAYVGQTSITTLGTITTGTWNGTIVEEIYGGTGRGTYTTGDILYSDATNSLTVLNLGTAYQKLKVNAGATAPEWVTEIGTVECQLGTTISAGAATSGFTFISNELVWEVQGSGGGGGAAKTGYYMFTVPEDYKSGGTMNVWSRRSGTPTWTLTTYVDDVVDATINAVNILPASDLTWTESNTNFGSTISAGSIIQVNFDFTGTNGNDIQIKSITFTYNR